MGLLHAVKVGNVASVAALLMSDDAVQLQGRPTMLAGGHA